MTRGAFIRSYLLAINGKAPEFLRLAVLYDWAIWMPGCQELYAKCSSDNI